MSPLRKRLLVVALASATIPSAWAQDTPAAPEQTQDAAHASSSAAASDRSQPDPGSTAAEEQLVGPVPTHEEKPLPTAGVKDEHPGPYVLGKIPSFWWVLWHPTQAWRIFEPLE